MQNDQSTDTNNIWDAIQKTGNSVIDTYRDIALNRLTTQRAIADASRAAPGGTPSQYATNTPIRQDNPFPQAQNKPTPGAGAVSVGGFSISVGMLIAVVLVFLFLRSR